MAGFLKFVSVVYLVLVWLIAALILTGSIFTPTPAFGGWIFIFRIGVIMSAGVLSIPAAALYGFGQIVGDVRQMRDDARLTLNNIRVVRRYYEPESASPDEPKFPSRMASAE